MPSWSGKTRGGSTGYSIFAYIIKNFGLSFSYFFLRFVIIYFFFFAPKSVKALYQYFRRIKKFSFFKSLRLIFRNNFIYGQTLIDKHALLAGYRTKLTFDFDGEKYLRQIAAGKKGGLLISAHVGNFEIAGFLLKRLEMKANLLMFNAEHEKIKAVQEKTFTEIAVNVISIKNDFSHMIEIKNAFDRNELVCMLGDRFVEGVKTLPAKFLGEEARFPTGPFYMAMKYDVPISFVFGMKEKKYHYHFYASAPKNYFQPQLNLKNRDQNITAIINDYIYELEKVLKKYPEQWFNYYDFWTEGKRRS